METFKHQPIVKIEWEKDDYDWHYFRVLGIAQGLIRIKGVYDPETCCKHEGNVIWVKVADISMMVEVDEYLVLRSDQAEGPSEGKAHQGRNHLYAV
jgi:hypothetical protein